MARYLNNDDVLFYRAKCDNSTYGPYSTIGAAKTQARNKRTRWSTPESMKVQQLVIDIEEFPDDFIARLAWKDIAEYKDGKWVDINE